MQHERDTSRGRRCRSCCRSGGTGESQSWLERSHNQRLYTKEVMMINKRRGEQLCVVKGGTQEAACSEIETAGHIGLEGVEGIVRAPARIHALALLVRPAQSGSRVKVAQGNPGVGHCSHANS